jgi:GTP:adenosylcobinamide-phosphate guanylyltransferase
MIWVIPLAGKGQRTKELGEFKPFIEINGHKMIEWFISSIKKLIKPALKKN